MLQNAIAKDGDFLYMRSDAPTASSTDEPELLMNDTIVAYCVTVKAKYLLLVVQQMIVLPTGGPVKKLIDMEDVHQSEHKLVLEILDHMCQNNFANVQEYIMELESRFAQKMADSSDVDTWSAMWFEVLRRCLVAARKFAKEKPGEKLPLPSKLLPPAAAVITKSFFSDAKKAAVDRESDEAATTEVKEETSEKKVAEEKDSSGADQVDPKTPFFESIYTMSDVPKSANQPATHALDVLALQAQLQHEIYMNAGQLGNIRKFEPA